MMSHINMISHINNLMEVKNKNVHFEIKLSNLSVFNRPNSGKSVDCIVKGHWHLGLPKRIDISY